MSLTKDQALDMLRSDDLLGIGMEADSVRKRLHPGKVVTYQIDRNVNYTNICTEYCSFCAFYRPGGLCLRAIFSRSTPCTRKSRR